MTPHPQELAKNLWMLGNGYSNLYLVRGRSASALVEVGISAVAETTMEQLEHLGVEPDYLVATHPHADHVTGLDAIRQRYPEAAVIAGPGSAEFLRHPKAAESLVSEDRHMSEFLEAAGFPVGRPSVTGPPALEPCAVVHEGDRIDLGGVTLCFHEATGHSPGNVLVHVPEFGALMASDSLGFRYARGGFLPLFFSGFSEYMETVDRLEALRPKVLGLGHQGPLAGEEVVETFRQARRAALDLLERVLAHRGADEELAEAIFQEAYRDELLLYTAENIRNCVGLLIRRSRGGRPGGRADFSCGAEKQPAEPRHRRNGPSC